MDITLWIELILFVLLMGFSGFFSSSETSLFSLNKLQLEQMRRDDNPRIGLIERMLSEPRRLIVTILIGNEFVNVAASVISAAIVIKLFGPDSKLWNLVVMIPILLLVGEITPKTLAIRNNQAFASFQCRPIDIFARMITPLRWIIRLIAEWFTTMIVGKELTRGSIVTEDMVRTLAHEAVGDGVLGLEEARYIDQIFDFGNKTLEEVMTPRSNIFFLPAELPLPEVISELRRTRHTKVPIYQGHRDLVAGILHSRDLLGTDLEELGKRPENLLGVLPKPSLVPESKPVADLFHTLRKRKLSMALTVDEYGGVTGMVTMEDLLECIFGELPSASEMVSEIEVLSNGNRQVDGAMTIENFNREFGGTLDEDEVETIGGLILSVYGELPPEGVSVTAGELEFTVVNVEHNRIQEVMVRKQASILDTPVDEDDEATTYLDSVPCPDAEDAEEDTQINPNAIEDTQLNTKEEKE